MSVAPNLYCDETKNRGTYTCVTSMVPWLGFNLAETTSAQKRPSTAGAQLRESPTLEGKQRNPAQGKAHCAGNLDSEKRTQQKAHAAQSQIPEDLWIRQEVLASMAGGTFTISHFLFPQTSREQEGGRRQEAQLRDSGEATPQHVPKALSAEPQ